MQISDHVDTLKTDVRGGEWLIDTRPDNSFTASSFTAEPEEFDDIVYWPYEAKYSGYGWCPWSGDTDKWVQVDLGSEYFITRSYTSFLCSRQLTWRHFTHRVSTKGSGMWYSDWVTEYRLMYSLTPNANDFISYGVLTGNADKSSSKVHILSSELYARYLRF